MDTVALAKSIISYDTESPPGDEESCARFIGDEIKDMHIEGAEVEVHSFAERRANLIATFRGDSPGLMLAGHIDVVPATEVERWRSPPFRPEVRSGKLYGRGAADMKSAVAAMVTAIGSLKGEKRKRSVALVATAGEEVDYRGVRAMVEDGKFERIGARFGVVGEPTGMRVVRAHKGGVDVRVIFEGRSAHASDPALGVNAIENCLLFTNELMRFRRELWKTSDEDLGRTLLTPTIITGGSKSNVIPGRCELTIDGRTIPAHKPRDVVRRMESIIRSLKKDDPHFRAKIVVGTQDEGLWTPKGNRLVKLCESITGSPSGVALYGSEAVLYTKQGITCVVLGPGSVKQAHIVDEYVTLRQLKLAESAYTRLIKEICL
jgi:succinyl-diaminopimelate desuccinylase